MKNLKKMISGLLAGVCFLLPAVSVSAEDVQTLPGGVSEDGLWNYSVYEDGTVSVVCQDKSITEAVVPEEIDGHKITIIELDCFKDNTNLKKVTLPESITVLEDYAFYLCSGLEEINIPKKLEKFGFQTFYGCSSLKRLTVPKTVTEIEGFTFEGCNALESIDVEQGNTMYKDVDGILFTADGSKLMQYPSAKEGTSYTVPADCTSLDDYAFMACQNLQTIDISSISEMGEDTFYYCTALQNMTVPEGITMLTGAVFGNCTSLESVTLPESLEVIGSGCFYNCVKLSNILIPASVKTINDNAFFNCASMTSITVPETVREIGDHAFGFYSDENEEFQHLPDFIVDAENGTPAFEYCAKYSVKCTGGITQGIVFVYIVLGIVALVIIAVIILVIMQKRYQKQHELF